MPWSISPLETERRQAEACLHDQDHTPGDPASLAILLNPLSKIVVNEILAGSPRLKPMGANLTLLAREMLSMVNQHCRSVVPPLTHVRGSFCAKRAANVSERWHVVARRNPFL
jgi:hypothetical protein